MYVSCIFLHQKYRHLYWQIVGKPLCHRAIHLRLSTESPEWGECNWKPCGSVINQAATLVKSKAISLSPLRSALCRAESFCLCHTVPTRNLAEQTNDWGNCSANDICYCCCCCCWCSNEIWFEGVELSATVIGAWFFTLFCGPEAIAKFIVGVNENAKFRFKNITNITQRNLARTAFLLPHWNQQLSPVPPC